MVKASDARVEHAWWTQGGHDMVSVINAPDEESMVAYTLAVLRLGNLRTTTCRLEPVSVPDWPQSR